MCPRSHLRVARLLADASEARGGRFERCPPASGRIVGRLKTDGGEVIFPAKFPRRDASASEDARSGRRAGGAPLRERAWGHRGVSVPARPRERGTDARPGSYGPAGRRRGTPRRRRRALSYGDREEQWRASCGASCRLLRVVVVVRARLHGGMRRGEARGARDGRRRRVWR